MLDFGRRSSLRDFGASSSKVDPHSTLLDRIDSIQLNLLTPLPVSDPTVVAESTMVPDSKPVSDPSPPSATFNQAPSAATEASKRMVHQLPIQPQVEQQPPSMHQVLPSSASAVASKQVQRQQPIETKQFVQPTPTAFKRVLRQRPLTRDSALKLSGQPLLLVSSTISASGSTTFSLVRFSVETICPDNSYW